MHDSSQPISHDVLKDTYLQSGEATLDDVRSRIARALSEAEPPGQRADWAARFLKAQRDGFVPAGRIAAYAGTAVRGTMASCFVRVPVIWIEDSDASAGVTAFDGSDGVDHPAPVSARTVNV